MHAKPASVSGCAPQKVISDVEHRPKLAGSQPVAKPLATMVKRSERSGVIYERKSTTISGALRTLI